MHRAWPDKAQEGGHGSGVAQQTQPGSRALHTCSPRLLLTEPAALLRTAFPSPLPWDFQKNHYAGTFVLGKALLPAGSQQSLLASAGRHRGGCASTAQNLPSLSLAAGSPHSSSLWDHSAQSRSCSQARLISQLQPFLSAGSGCCYGQQLNPCLKMK